MSDLTDAQSALATYEAAYTAVVAGQSYSMGSFTLTRLDVKDIQTEIHRLRRRILELTAQSAAATGDFAYRQPGVAVARVR